jgi:hypothetical protein
MMSSIACIEPLPATMQDMWTLVCSPMRMICHSVCEAASSEIVGRSTMSSTI